MSRRIVRTAESVCEGHPDKVADAISDAVLDACLAQDPRSRVACECLVKAGTVVLAGEITTRAALDLDAVVRRTIRDIGYVHAGDSFHADTVTVIPLLTQQATDIARSVEGQGEQGAGDQGLVFGYACDETPELLPSPIAFAHRLARRLAHLRRTGAVDWLRPDAKTQVSVEYDGDEPCRITCVVISTQHAPDVPQERIREVCVDEVIRKVLPSEMLDERTLILINPSGRFVEGGPSADAGLTGRKIIVDTYGGWGRHGGGAFSGKDPSKVDRSAAYMARHVAKTVVAAGLASRCEIQVAYAIGVAEPVSLLVDTLGTGIVDDARIENAVRTVFSFKPADIARHLNLLRPIYSKTTQHGHFGKDDPDLTWESTPQVQELLEAAGAAARGVEDGEPGLAVRHERDRAPRQDTRDPSMPAVPAPITCIPDVRLAAYRTAVFVLPEDGEAHRIATDPDVHEFGIVTSFNPGRMLTDEENEARHRHLLAEVERRGLRHGEMFGASPDEAHQERSLLITADDAIIRKLGAMCDQEAVFFTRQGDVYLMACSGHPQRERLGIFVPRVRLSGRSRGQTRQAARRGDAGGTP